MGIGAYALGPHVEASQLCQHVVAESGRVALFLHLGIVLRCRLLVPRVELV
jgi:hypothetical protein